MAKTTYYCAYWSKIEASDCTPSQVGCTKGSSHYWWRAGEPGEQVWECNYCKLTLNLKSSPNSTVGCPKGSSHYWKRK
mgnify:FL=1